MPEADVELRPGDLPVGPTITGAAPSRWIGRGLAVISVPMLIAGSSIGAAADAGRSSGSSLADDPSLVRVTETSNWSPPSPDPSGIEYVPGSNSLLVSDAEAEETPLWAGVNVFRATTTGALTGTASTWPSFSDEPTGVAVNPASGDVFFSDDVGQDQIYEVHVGPDGQYGTGDDSVTSFATKLFGSTDPEGLAFGGGKLFISDGLGTEVFVLAPGPNGAIDGGGDDLVTHWDTSSLGQPDPEGIAYNGDLGTLFLVSNRRKWDVTETTTQGQPVAMIELSFVDTHSPGGLAYGPGSADPTQRVLYLADRGADSEPGITNNDGRLFEITLGRTGTPQLLLKATRRKVQPGDRLRLIARILPCSGHEGDVIAFNQRGREVANKVSNAACVARARVRIWRTSSFRAAQPEVGVSNRVKIRVKRMMASAAWHTASSHRAFSGELVPEKPII